MKSRFLFLATVLTVLFSGPIHAATMDSLAKKLAGGAASLENKKVAVLSFPYHDEKVSSGSTLLSEQLTTCLVGRKEVRVLERHLIDELLKERKLCESGVIDPMSLRTLGKMLDADAVVTGTLIDLPNNKTELNARLIRTDTGEVLSAGQVVVDRTWLDVPATIKPSPVAKTADPVVERKDQPALEVDGSELLETPTLSGKSKRLSNESFPPERRRYISDVPARSPARTSTTLKSGTGYPRGQDRETEYYTNESNTPSGSTRSSSRSEHIGYNGTDTPTLAPSRLSYPLGTVRTERRTYSNPSRSTTPSRSSSSNSHK